MGQQNDSGSAGDVDRSEGTYLRLRELIVGGKIAPGSRVVETELADRLDVSRTPVRYALQRLQQEGYVIPAGEGKRAGSAVAPLTREDAIELFYIVGQLESMASRWAAGLDDGPRRELTREMRQINGELDDAAASTRPDRNLYFELDARFHQTYLDAAAGPRLLSMHESIKPQADRYARFYVNALIDEIDTSVEEHQHIVEHIEAGEADQAEIAVRTNWRNAAHRLSEVIGAMGEWGSW
jgi:DNA-binding GntR family transcriptional regulator